MIKTIKVKKQMRLDELIKYAIEKGLNSCQFTSDNNVDVYFSSNGYFLIAGDGSGDGGGRSFDLSDTFTVEVEEEITKDTRFKGVQEIYIDDEGLLQLEYHPIVARKSLNDVLEEHDEETECLYIYAAVDGKTELIWEAE